MTARYSVEGCTHPESGVAELAPHGDFAPFVVFDVLAQDWLPLNFLTRRRAALACWILNTAEDLAARLAMPSKEE